MSSAIAVAIVRLLIESASMLGKVPCEVDVVAKQLEVNLRMTKAASLDNLDGSPVQANGKKTKQRTSTISGIYL